MSEDSPNHEKTMTVTWSEEEERFLARLADQGEVVGQGETSLEALQDLEQKLYGPPEGSDPGEKSLDPSDAQDRDLILQELSPEGQKALDRRWRRLWVHKDKIFKSKLYRWVFIGCFIAFTLGVLAGMGLVWVNDTWVPFGT